MKRRVTDRSFHALFSSIRVQMWAMFRDYKCMLAPFSMPNICKIIKLRSIIVWFYMRRTKIGIVDGAQLVFVVFFVLFFILPFAFCVWFFHSNRNRLAPSQQWQKHKASIQNAESESISRRPVQHIFDKNALIAQLQPFAFVWIFVVARARVLVAFFALAQSVYLRAFIYLQNNKIHVLTQE